MSGSCCGTRMASWRPDSPVPKDPQKGLVPSNYLTIILLSTTSKLLSRITLVKINRHMDQCMSEALKGMGRNPRGAKHQLLRDRRPDWPTSPSPGRTTTKPGKDGQHRWRPCSNHVSLFPKHAGTRWAERRKQAERAEAQKASNIQSSTKNQPQTHLWIYYYSRTQLPGTWRQTCQGRPRWQRSFLTSWS